jgi:hypothetical protein
MDQMRFERSCRVRTEVNVGHGGDADQGKCSTSICS